MREELNLLIVDDHSLMIEGYRSILAHNNFGWNVTITSATSATEALEIIQNTKNKNFDLFLLDWILPIDQQTNIYNGGDLIGCFREYFHNAKIIVLTSHSDAFTLYDIIKKFNPSGVLNKSDFNSEEFLEAINIILGDGIFYSPMIKKHIKDLNSRDNYFDNYNRQIILLLSKGVKTKNLPNFLPISLSAIDKRKAQIRDWLLISKGNDEDIIREAKKIGLI